MWAWAGHGTSLNGNSVIGVHVRTNICYRTCFRHSIRAISDTKWVFFSPKRSIFLCVRASYILSYHLIQVPWSWLRIQTGPPSSADKEIDSFLWKVNQGLSPYFFSFFCLSLPFFPIFLTYLPLIQRTWLKFWALIISCVLRTAGNKIEIPLKSRLLRIAACFLSHTLTTLNLVVSVTSESVNIFQETKYNVWL